MIARAFGATVNGIEELMLSKTAGSLLTSAAALERGLGPRRALKSSTSVAAAPRDTTLHALALRKKSDISLAPLSPRPLVCYRSVPLAQSVLSFKR